MIALENEDNRKTNVWIFGLVWIGMHVFITFGAGSICLVFSQFNLHPYLRVITLRQSQHLLLLGIADLLFFTVYIKILAFEGYEGLNVLCFLYFSALWVYLCRVGITINEYPLRPTIAKWSFIIYGGNAISCIVYFDLDSIFIIISPNISNH